MESELTAHLTTAAVIVYGIEWLKQRGGFRWLNIETKRLNRIVSGICAAIAAAGINWTYDPALGTLVVTGLTWTAVLTTASEWVKQFMVQQVLYDGVVQKAGAAKG